MAVRIDGKKMAADIKEELKGEVAALKEKGITCCLAVIQVGDDPASSVYVGNKKKACGYIGIESRSYELPETATEEELLALIERLNLDDQVNAVLCQLPLPAHIDEKRDFSRKGCGRLSSAECGCALHRTARLCLLHAGRHYTAS